MEVDSYDCLIVEERKKTIAEWKKYAQDQEEFSYI